MAKVAGAAWLLCLGTVAGFLFSGFAGKSEEATPQLTIYVSADGNDAWSGRLPEPNPQRSDGPVATVQKALELGRAWRETQGKPDARVRVVLRGSTYFLDSTIVISPEDSWTTLVSAEGERAVLSGGVRLTGWVETHESGLRL